MRTPFKLTILFILLAGSAAAAVLTNADVIKLAKANVDPSVIIAAIRGSEGKYDVSAEGLIELSAANVPQAVIKEVIQRSSAPVASPSQPAVAPAPAADLMSPSEVLIVDGQATTRMRYLNPQMRTAVRGLGFGGVATYAVLVGSRANERTTNSQPSFLVSVPDQAQVESYLTIAHFAVRRNNSREVMIGGGYMSYSSGIVPDRVVAVSSEKLADQSRAQKGFTIYKVTPAQNLAAGEYAVILSTKEMYGVVSAWFGSAGNSYFDFGVD